MRPDLPVSTFYVRRFARIWPAHMVALILARQQLAETGARYLDALRRFAGAMAAVRALERGVMLDMTEGPGPIRVMDPGANEALH